MHNLDFFSKWQFNQMDIFANSNNIKMDAYNKGLPFLYSVYLLNNNQIPVSFYIFIIEEFFHHKKNNEKDSFNELRRNGYICYRGFTRDVAESKISNITSIARSSNYSLKCLTSKDNNYVIKKPRN